MGTKKPPLRGGFFEHFTFTGDGINRVAEVESCTLSSTMWADYIEKVPRVSTVLTEFQFNVARLRRDPTLAEPQGLHHSPAPTLMPIVLRGSPPWPGRPGQHGMPPALD